MRTRILREYYCTRCSIVKRRPRSTGVKLLLGVTKIEGKRALDFRCSNWRNSKYLEAQGAYVVRMDTTPDTKPNIVEYPTYIPFRDKVFNIAPYTHTHVFKK